VRARRLRCITGLSSAAGAALGRRIAGDHSAHRQQGLQQKLPASHSCEWLAGSF